MPTETVTETTPDLFTDTEAPESEPSELPESPAESVSSSPEPVVMPDFDPGQASVGEILQYHRMFRGMTLEDCFEALYIRKVSLEALEAEDLAALPQSQTTVCSYIGAYARLLELDAEALVQQFSARHYPKITSASNYQPRPLPSLPTNTILVLVFCVLLILIGVGLVHNYLNTEEAATVTETVIAPPPRHTVSREEPIPAPETVVVSETDMTAEPAPATADHPALSGVQIRHDTPLWTTLENPDGTASRFQLQPGIPLEIVFGAGKKIFIDDFREVMITLMDSDNVPSGDVPYSILADSDGWVSIDSLEQE